MITLVGTSHISPESVEAIPRHIDRYSPDVVAIELDPYRFQALKTGERESVGNPFLALVQFIQQQLGKKTGISPGDEFVEAADIAEQRGIPVAFIDQPIPITSRRLLDIPLVEKIKIAGSMLLGFISPFGDKVDLAKVPDQQFVQELLVHVRTSFPNLYRVLVTERNDFMAEQLQQLEQEAGDVLAFVGAGHLDGLRERLT